MRATAEVCEKKDRGRLCNPMGVLGRNQRRWQKGRLSLFRENEGKGRNEEGSVLLEWRERRLFFVLALAGACGPGAWVVRGPGATHGCHCAAGDRAEG